MGLLAGTMIQKTTLLAAIAVLLGLSTCQKPSRPWLERDVSKVKVDYQRTRLAPALFEGPKAEFRARLDSVYNQYPDLINLYATRVIGLGPPRKDTNAKLMAKFVHDRYWQEVYKASQETYPNLRAIDQELKQAFQYYKSYYPSDALPNIFTLVKGIDLRYKVVTLQDQALIIFLDMYLGKDYKYYPSQYPDYRIERFTKSHIALDVVETLFQTRYPKDSFTNKSFLSRMLYRGKKLHFMKSMMPNRHDTSIMRYSLEDWKWCRTFEQKIWDHFVNQELLYETNAKKYTDFLKEGPFTSAGGIPPDSPPRIGAFIGWQIIQAYRRNQKQATLPQLMKSTKYQNILNQSGYSP